MQIQSFNKGHAHSCIMYVLMLQYYWQSFSHAWLWMSLIRVVEHTGVPSVSKCAFFMFSPLHTA